LVKEDNSVRREDLGESYKFKDNLPMRLFVRGYIKIKKGLI